MFATNYQIAGPSLPTWFLFPVAGLFAILTAYWIINTRGRAARYLLFACYARYTLGAFHEFTYREAPGGLRWVAIGSIVLISLGLVVLDKRRLLSRPFIPVGVICMIMAVSAILNRDIPDAIDPMLRFLFFVLTAVALWQALEANGPSVLRRLLLIFVQPLVFQLASVVLDLPKSGELDGSLSYIGGYYHEELFSLILATAFLVATLAKNLRLPVKIAVLTASFIGIFLTDYRTSMLAVLPLAITTVFSAVPRTFRRDQQTLVRIVIGIAGCIAMVAAVGLMEDRFSDLTEVVHAQDLIKPPEQYSFADQRVLSSRPFIWSQYITAYAEAPQMQKIIGFGPDSWVGKFPLYAHNTIISFLYETGVVGVAALLWLWFSMFRLALADRSRDRSVLIAGHIAFLMLNLATMPHWQIEGNIFYGLLCGYSIAKARLTRKREIAAASIEAPDWEWPIDPNRAKALPFHPE